jgi:hypothetical protein
VKLLRLAWRVLRGKPDDYQVEAITTLLERQGVLCGLRIDPNPEGAGFRFRSNNPQLLLVSTNLFDSVPGVWLREADGSGELLLFVDHAEFEEAIGAR